jgi:hypothetical protein
MAGGKTAFAIFFIAMALAGVAVDLVTRILGMLTLIIFALVVIFDPPVSQILAFFGRTFAHHDGTESYDELCLSQHREHEDWRDKVAGEPLRAYTSKKDGFCDEYHGYRPENLSHAREKLLEKHGDDLRFIYLVGDSSLDNKDWFSGSNSQGSATNGFESILRRGDTVCKDVAYWLNAEAESGYQKAEHSRVATLCAAVEESTIWDRRTRLLPHDEFVRESLTSSDMVVVSVGGNDVALNPTVCTVVAMAWLVYCTPSWAIECGLGGPALWYFKRLMGRGTHRLVQRLVELEQPAKVAVCMLYFPGPQTKSGSWADMQLGLLRYNTNPAKLQLVIRSLFKEVQGYWKSNPIRGVNVVCVPLYEQPNGLDSTDPCDYEQRVEPSVQGGRKMAKKLLGVLLNTEDSDDQKRLEDRQRHAMLASARHKAGLRAVRSRSRSTSVDVRRSGRTSRQGKKRAGEGGR